MIRISIIRMARLVAGSFLLQLAAGGAGLAQGVVAGDAYISPCDRGQAVGADSTCVNEVNFHAGSTDDAEIAAKLARNGWRLATPTEVTDAWRLLGLNQHSFGKMADGGYAAPAQADAGPALKRGVNIRDEGVAMFSKGFFYVNARAPAAPAPVTAPATAPSPTPTASATGCPGGQTAVDGVCQGSINIAGSGAPTAPPVIGENDPAPVQYFANLAADQCADPGNFMLDGWNGAERPIVEAAGHKIIFKKGFGYGAPAMSDLVAKLKADPTLRWEFAPFMIESAWMALTAAQPTPAQASFRNRFEVWAGCDKNLTARRTLARWNQHLGRSDSGSNINGVGIVWIDPNPQYDAVTLSVLNERGPSISGFDVTNGGNPLYIGHKGKAAIATLYTPMKVRSTPEFDDIEDLRLIQEDLTGVMVGTGIGLGVGFTAATTYVVGTIPVYLGINKAIFTATTNAALHAAELSAVAGSKAAAGAATSGASKLTGAAIGKSISTAAAPVVIVAAIAAAVFAETLADVIKTKDFEDGLLRDSKSTARFDVAAALGPNPDDVQKMSVFTLLMKMLISEPADRNALTLQFPGLDCPMGLSSIAGTCLKKIEFLASPSLSLAAAKQHADANGWRLATPEEIEKAWSAGKYHQYAFGMMSDGRFAVPLQADKPNFKRGHNIGATGGNQGFFYVREFMEPDVRGKSRAYIQSGADLAVVVTPAPGEPVLITASRNADWAAWTFVRSGDAFRIQSPRSANEFLYFRNGAMKIGAIAADDPAGLWRLHHADKSFYRIENVALAHRYLRLDGGKLTAGYVEPNDKGAIWHIPASF